MENIEYLLGFIIGVFILIWFLKRFFRGRQRIQKRKIFLSRRVRIKADRKFNKLLTKFKNKHHHKPNRKELRWIVVNASHMTIRRGGHSGHWGRQKVRKYLLEKNKIVDNYIMK
jgi:hypothetical protein